MSEDTLWLIKCVIFCLLSLGAYILCLVALDYYFDYMEVKRRDEEDSKWN